MTAQTEVEKLDFKRVLPIFIVVLVDLLGLTIIIPLLPLYATAFGADPLTIGLLGASYPTMQLIGGPLLGGLSDRYGRKPVLIVSQIGTFIGFMILGFANTLPALFLARIVDGLSGANIVAAQAAITDLTTEKTRAQGLGLIGAAFGLGFILGPAIAGISLALTDNNYHVPAFLAAGFSLISVLLTSFWMRETLGANKAIGETKPTFRSSNPLGRILYALGLPMVGVLLLLMFAQQLVFGGYEALLALFNLNRLGLNGRDNAIIFVFAGIIIVMIQGRYVGPLSRKYGERKLIFAGLVFLAAGLILTSITPPTPVPWYSRTAMEQELSRGETAPSESSASQTLAVALPADEQNGWFGLFWLLIATIPACIGGGLLSPSINSLITKSVPANEVGGTLGVSASLVSAANALTPLAGGAIFQFFGSTAPFLLGGGLLLLLYVVAINQIKPIPEQPPALPTT